MSQKVEGNEVGGRQTSSTVIIYLSYPKDGQELAGSLKVFCALLMYILLFTSSFHIIICLHAESVMKESTNIAMSYYNGNCQTINSPQHL